MQDFLHKWLSILLLATTPLEEAQASQVFNELDPEFREEVFFRPAHRFLPLLWQRLLLGATMDDDAQVDPQLFTGDEPESLEESTAARASARRSTRRLTIAGDVPVAELRRRAEELEPGRAPSLAESTLNRVLKEKIVEMTLENGRSVAKLQAQTTWMVARDVTQEVRGVVAQAPSPWGVAKTVTAFGVTLPFRITGAVGRMAYRNLAPEAIKSTVAWYNDQVARSEQAQQSMLEDQTAGSESACSSVESRDFDRPASEGAPEDTRPRRRKPGEPGEDTAVS